MTTLTPPTVTTLPAAYDYHPARSLPEALELLQRYGDEDAHAIAGGTSLVLMMKQGLVQPGHLVGLRGIPGLAEISLLPDGGLQIGALATHRQVERSPHVMAYCPALAEAEGHVATIRIRNQATLGGNLAHADPAQDPPPILLALDARLQIAGPNGERTLSLSDFFVDYFETALEPGELIVSVLLPPLPAGTRAAYEKFLPRSQDDYATVAVAAVLQVGEDNRCQDVRIGLGALGTTPLRATRVEAALRGQPLTPALVKDSAALVRDEVDPLDDVRGSAGYKREMARVWTERTLLTLAGHSWEGRP